MLFNLIHQAIIGFLIVTMKLSVNLNKISLLRESRGGALPSFYDFAKLALDQNIVGLTLHPRPDQRHIVEADIKTAFQLIEEYKKELNIEGNPGESAKNNYKGYLELVREYKPHQATLVPDSSTQLTSDHGWDILNSKQLIDFASEIRESSNICSIFIDTDITEKELESILNKNINAIELYTGPYAEACLTDCESDIVNEISKIRNVANSAKEKGLKVNAGHDLNTKNLPALRELGLIDEVSIGHAIICESLSKGFEKTVNEYIDICNG